MLLGAQPAYPQERSLLIAPAMTMGIPLPNRRRPSCPFSLHNVTWLTDSTLCLSYPVAMMREGSASRTDPKQVRCHASIRQPKGVFS